MSGAPSPDTLREESRKRAAKQRIFGGRYGGCYYVDGREFSYYGDALAYALELVDAEYGAK